MEPLATLEELSDYTGQDAGTGNGEMALLSASDIVRDYCERRFSLEEGVTAKLNGAGWNGLVIPHPPIRSVTSVTENDVALVEDTDYLSLGEAGILRRLGGVWPVGTANIVVVYDRGYDVEFPVYPGPGLPLPNVVRQVTLQIAKRLLAAGTLPVGGFRREQIGQYEYEMAEGGSETFAVAADERAALGPYTRGTLA